MIGILFERNIPETKHLQRYGKSHPLYGVEIYKKYEKEEQQKEYIP